MDNTPDISLGEALRIYRVSRLLGVNELGQRAKVSPSLISMIEKGKHSRPRLSTLRALCDALGLDAAERALLVKSFIVPALMKRRDEMESLKSMPATFAMPPLDPNEEAFLERCRRSVAPDDGSIPAPVRGPDLWRRCRRRKKPPPLEGRMPDGQHEDARRHRQREEAENQ